MAQREGDQPCNYDSDEDGRRKDKLKIIMCEDIFC